MSRKSRLTLLVLVPLVLAAAFYVGTWYYLAGVTRAAVQNWAEARRAEGFTIGWDRYAISGFPLTLRVTIEKPVFGRTDAAPGYEARAPLLVGEARPWAFQRWHVMAANGARLSIDPGPARPAVMLQAETLDGTLAPRDDASAAREPGTLVALAADGLSIDSGVHIAIAHAAAQAALPSHPVLSHLETWLSATLELDRTTLPAPVQPLGDTIDRVAARLAVKGAIPTGPRRQALTAWRDDGGTLEIEKIDLGWGKLGVSANGTLALDEALQPQGALTATISGYGEIVDALVAAGTMKAGDAALAKLALGLLAKPGADGTAQINAPVTLQSGRLFIGPARLARLPTFTWE